MKSNVLSLKSKVNGTRALIRSVLYDGLAQPYASAVDYSPPTLDLRLKTLD
jgi:hypothetical protein